MDSARVRAFIDQAFGRTYGAPNAAGYAEYLTVRDRAHVRAALGYRRAGAEPLFLEQYLDQPIEESVSAVLRRRVERDRIIEIGNLAADNAWSMIALWGAAANDLSGSHEVVVATLTGSLRRMFARIGIPVHELAPADPARLGTAVSDWGKYYLADPCVCAGPIAEGQRSIAAFFASRHRERAA